MPDGPSVPTDSFDDVTRYAITREMVSGKWQIISRAMVTSANYTRTSDEVVLPMEAPRALWFPIEDIASDDSFNFERFTLMVNCGTGNVAITLPDAEEYPGSIFILKRLDDSANTLTLYAEGDSLIDGKSSVTLTRPNATIWVHGDGVNWWILAALPTTPGNEYDNILTDSNGDVLSDSNGDVLTE